MYIEQVGKFHSQNDSLKLKLSSLRKEMKLNASALKAHTPAGTVSATPVIVYFNPALLLKSSCNLAAAPPPARSPVSFGSYSPCCGRRRRRLFQSRGTQKRLRRRLGLKRKVVLVPTKAREPCSSSMKKPTGSPSLPKGSLRSHAKAAPLGSAQKVAYQ